LKGRGAVYKGYWKVASIVRRKFRFSPYGIKEERNQQPKRRIYFAFMQRVKGNAEKAGTHMEEGRRMGTLTEIVKKGCPEGFSERMGG